MSKERELLKRCLDRLDWRYSRPMVDLHDEIQELLNHPEQGLYGCGLGKTPTKEVSDELS